jgi:DNA-binding NtrC family response regulator
VTLKILVVDDELGRIGGPQQKAFLRAFGALPFDFLFESCVRGSGFEAALALRALELNGNVDLVLLDIRFGAAEDRLGYEILRQIVARFPSVPVLMMSSVDRDVQSLGQCLEDGAVGFVAKRQEPAAFRRTVEQAVAIARSHVLVGQSPPLRELRRQAARLSPYDQIPVLIVGERGTGKERVARYIHHNGPRSQGPFVAMNCAGLAESLLEVELFGAEKGAYTGADVARLGYLEHANGGTLFLDEISNMPLTMQAKLLRVLQDHAFRRVGVSSREITVDFQILSATNEEPQELIASRRLREDLYDRVAAVTVRTPPLRACTEDIPELTRHFLREFGIEEAKEVSSDVLDRLARYSWPGNMRELRRVLQEAVVMSEGAALVELCHLPERFITSASEASISIDAALESATLPADPESWSRARLLTELRMAVAAKGRIKEYKGSRWKAEFMRLLYPECRARNAKGFSDLVRRLTKGPWGSAALASDGEGGRLLSELLEP